MKFHTSFGRIPRLAACIALQAVWLACPAFSQTSWTSKVTDTPSLIQNDFGIYGSSLPGDGEDYCGPTAAAMSMGWLYNNGYTQLAPTLTLSSTNDYNNLVNVLAGLMDTSPTGGTPSGAAQLTGIETYLAAKGFSGQYSIAQISNPSLSFLDTLNTGNTVVNLNIQWFDYTEHPDGSYSFTNNGGHFIDLLATDTTTSQITINNPMPSALESEPDIPSSNPQVVTWAGIPNTWNLSEADQLITPIIGVQTGTKGTIAAISDETSWTINELPSDTLVPANWEIDTSTTLNTNGGNLDVSAPLTGTGGIYKIGGGTLLLTASDALTGANTIVNGTLGSTASASKPFGSGPMTIGANGMLAFTPSGISASPVALEVASGPGAALTASGGGYLLVDTGSNDGVTLTIGSHTDGSTANIVRDGENGTLILQAAQSGSSAILGGIVKILVKGSGSNLPRNETDTGIVAPWIIAADTAGNGSFVQYDSINGFETVPGTSSSGLSINDAALSDVYSVDNNQTITSAFTAKVGAIAVQSGNSVSGDATTVLDIGSGGSGAHGGIIFNGGSIDAGKVDFSQSEALIYASPLDGSISSRIAGSGGLTLYGPGTLTLTGDSGSTLSGMVTVEGGSTLIAANSGGSATGSGLVNVREESTLVVQGTVTGSVEVQSTGALILAGGTVKNDVIINPSGTLTDTGSLIGTGTITGHTTINGAGVLGAPISGATTGNAGPIIFDGKFDMDASAQYVFELTSFTDDSTVLAGGPVTWDKLIFNDDANMGEGGYITTLLSFNSLTDPNDPNAFWDVSHTWTIFDFTGSYSYGYEFPGNSQFADGSFTITSEGGTAWLEFTPVPEPAVASLMAFGAAVLYIRRRRAGI